MAKPEIRPDRIGRHLRDRYGLTGQLEELPSERDRNFLLDTARERYVVKVCHVDTMREEVASQHRAMEALKAASGFAVPSVVPSRDGHTITHTGDAPNLVHVLTHLSGRTLANVNPVTPSLLESVGRIAREIPRLLEAGDVKGPEGFLWDLRTAGNVAHRYLEYVVAPDIADLVDSSAAKASAVVATHAPALEHSTIHGDLNDANVLVGHRGLGVIDFGDVHRSFAVAELAVATAYGVIRLVDPLSGIADAARGANAVQPLTEAEAAVLVPLVKLRLVLSVAIGAAQTAADPHNPHLAVSHKHAIASLQRLAAVPPGLAAAKIRNAIGLPAVATVNVVRRFLEDNTNALSPPLALDMRPDSVCQIDWGVTSRLAENVWGATAADHEAQTNELMRRAGATVGLGRWGEARLVYTTAAYDVPSNTGPRSRTVHCGVDLSCPKGTPVLAICDGAVERIDDEAVVGGYGPVITLRHTTSDGVAFWSLYGHLGPVDPTLSIGDNLASGTPIGHVGGPPGNGDWAPHLHFQLMTDLLGIDGPFPGVANPDDWDVWKEICPCPAAVLGLREDFVAAPLLDDESVLESRRQRLPSAMSTSYTTPLVAMRGRGAYLFDSRGRPFLDMVNNVAHVGHEHPHVVEAIVDQVRVLNTNSRYPHPERMRYVERLADLFPEPLDTVFLVNSGSEANDLALRIATVVTGRSRLVVSARGYHGATAALIEASHYKHGGAGGAGTPEHVTVLPLPDVYRDEHSDHAERAVATIESIGPVAAGLFEAMPGVGGQVVLPQGYLAALSEAVRGAGGLFVADEVQTGLGRIGPEMWAYRVDGALADIVTLGKPIGNGHPLGAVITSRDIAGEFANGMEYFNTFGGNPVSCSAGNAVLDVLFDEALQEHSIDMGASIARKLAAVSGDFPIVGDVRGRGLFMGVELVLDPDAKTPAPRQTAYVVDRCRDLGVLLSKDGPADNVLKLKPPLVFDETDAELLVATLRRVLAEDPAQIS